MNSLVNRVFAVTIFFSAFLLFQVQPIIAKVLLPWFGGTPAVWSTCLVFFQSVLVCGYLYAYLLVKIPSSKLQVFLHIAVISITVLSLSLMPENSWEPIGKESPIGYILLLLLVHVGAPYFVLATTTPLIHDWFSKCNRDRSPYRLYALSNIASFLALLSYPFFFETTLRLLEQTQFWEIGFYVFAAFCTLAALCAAHPKLGSIVEASELENDRAYGFVERAICFGFAAVGSILLLGITNHVSSDVAVVPFLWIVPLSLYLLSFVVCFDSDRWYRRGIYTILCVVLMLLFCEGRSGSSRQRCSYGRNIFFCNSFCFLHGVSRRIGSFKTAWS